MWDFIPSSSSTITLRRRGGEGEGKGGPHFPSFFFAAAAVLAVSGSLTGHFGSLTPLPSLLN